MRRTKSSSSTRRIVEAAGARSGSDIGFRCGGVGEGPGEIYARREQG
jgi:hypothetical protein